MYQSIWYYTPVAEYSTYTPIDTDSHLQRMCQLPEIEIERERVREREREKYKERELSGCI